MFGFLLNINDLFVDFITPFAAEYNAFRFSIIFLLHSWNILILSECLIKDFILISIPFDLHFTTHIKSRLINWKNKLLQCFSCGL